MVVVVVASIEVLLMGFPFQPSVLAILHLLVLDFFENGDLVKLVSGQQAPLNPLWLFQSLGHAEHFGGRDNDVD